MAGTRQSPHDVLFGRGKCIQKHPANVNLRMLVDAHKERYLAARRFEKLEISKSIVAKIKQGGDDNNPGRFLRQDPSTGHWVEVTDDVACKKVSHALRENKEKQNTQRTSPEKARKKTVLAKTRRQGVSPAIKKKQSNDNDDNAPIQNHQEAPEPEQTTSRTSISGSLSRSDIAATRAINNSRLTADPLVLGLFPGALSSSFPPPLYVPLTREQAILTLLQYDNLRRNHHHYYHHGSWG